MDSKPTTNSAYLAAKLGLACLAMLTALSVYVFARPNSPVLLSELHWHSDWLAAYSDYLYNAPSFFYTLAIGLFIGVCASTRTAARRHCAIWVGIAAVLEATQATTIAGRIVDWLGTLLPAALWDLIGPYWQRGVFDPLDLVATLAGGAFAILLLSRFPTEKADETED
ncbi:MAG: hypothetical protein GWP56_18180 [Gammaproteobacteria bacterium]|jgi:hypothetical protein|nr:hypothetical protein [Gammaproteobacteria bacterium]